jgi:hypothetical protein
VTAPRRFDQAALAQLLTIKCVDCEQPVQGVPWAWLHGLALFTLHHCPGCPSLVQLQRQHQTPAGDGVQQVLGVYGDLPILLLEDEQT